MKKDKLKLLSLLMFFILTMSLMLKLHNREMEYKKKEIEYHELLSESRRAIMEAAAEKAKLKEEFTSSERTLQDKIREQTEIINLQREELENLEEFKNILDTVKKFSGRNMGEEEAVITALSLYRAQRETRLDWKVLAALIMTESSYRADIVSQDPSYGLMQLMLPTANHINSRIGKRKLSESELLNIERNIELGSQYLLSQVIRFSSLSEGIMAYNFGPGRLITLKKEKQQSFESGYLKKIKRYHEKIDNYIEDKRVAMH